MLGSLLSIVIWHSSGIRLAVVGLLSSGFEAAAEVPDMVWVTSKYINGLLFWNTTHVDPGLVQTPNIIWT